MNVESDVRVIKNSAENVYSYLTDFNNFTHLMPEQIEKWECTADSCSFHIKGFFHLGLEVKEKEPFHTIVIGEGAGIKSPFPFEMKWELNEKEPHQTSTKVSLSANVNPMIGMMAKKPLHNLANVMIEKLDEMLG